MTTQRHSYDYPRPMVTVDVVLFRGDAKKREVLLIQRGREPFAGMWALPGGYIEMDETLEASALRELEEETGVGGIALKQFRAYGDPGRDPRGRTVSVVFLGEAEAGAMAQAGDDAAAAQWFALGMLPEMAFDHAIIVQDAVRHRESAQGTRR